MNCLSALSFGSLTSATLGGLAGSHNVTLLNDSSTPSPLPWRKWNDDDLFRHFLRMGSLIKSGTGTLVLSSAGAYTLNSTTNVNAGTLQVGSSSSTSIGGSVTLNSGGTLVTPSGGATITSTGTLQISGGTYSPSGDVTVDGGSFQYASGTFNLATGKSLIKNNAQVNIAASYTLTNGNTFTIQSGADLTTSSLQITSFTGSAADGTVIMNGAGSSWTDSGSSLYGYNGTATIDFRNAATGTLGFFNMDEVHFSFGTDSLTVDVATVTLKNITAGNSNQQDATITVTDPGSSISISPFGLTLGFLNPPGIGFVDVVNVSNGGTFTVGTSTVTIDSYGTLNLSGGTFNASGNMILNGGRLKLST